MSDKYYWMWREEKKKHESEVEASPEMKVLQNRIKELENSLSIALENISDNQLKTK